MLFLSSFCRHQSAIREVPASAPRRSAIQAKWHGFLTWRSARRMQNKPPINFLGSEAPSVLRPCSFSPLATTWVALLFFTYNSQRLVHVEHSTRFPSSHDASPLFVALLSLQRFLSFVCLILPVSAVLLPASLGVLRFFYPNIPRYF